MRMDIQNYPNNMWHQYVAVHAHGQAELPAANGAGAQIWNFFHRWKKLNYPNKVDVPPVEKAHMSKNHNTQLNRRKWNRIRQQVFERDGYRCVKCGRAGRLECDHIIPLSKGGEVYSASNLQSMCRSCHFEKTRSENGRVLTADQLAWKKFVTNL